MGFTDAIRTCLRKYVTFSGRATRPEYWWFILFTVLGSFAAGVADAILFGPQTYTLGVPEDADYGFEAEANGPIAALFSLFILLPSLSAGWRRMHDTGRSGLYLLYPLIVLLGLGMAGSVFGGIGALADGAVSGVGAVVLGLGAIVLIVSPLLVLWWLTRPSQPADNAFGPNPHAARTSAAPWGTR